MPHLTAIQKKKLQKNSNEKWNEKFQKFQKKKNEKMKWKIPMKKKIPKNS